MAASRALPDRAEIVVGSGAHAELTSQFKLLPGTSATSRVHNLPG
jgi:hypothetical protein